MVSIVIPNWNGARYIEVCLGSLERQTYKDFELIFVDNNSEDSSIEIVKRQFPRAHVVTLEENKGFATAANEGIKVGRGDYIALLNNDTESDPHWLEELLKGMDRSKAIGMCASKIIQFDDRSKLDTAGDGYTTFGVSIKRGHGLKPDEYSKEEFVFGACAAAALYRKSMLDEIGYFDEGLFCIYEDVDLSFRAQLAGFQCLYVPTATVYHLLGGTAGRNNDFTLYYGQRNLETVFLKNMPRKLLIKYLPLHLGYNVLGFIQHIFKKNAKKFLQSKIDAMKQIRSTLQKRRAVQGKKRVSSFYLRSLFDNRSLLQHKAKAS